MQEHIRRAHPDHYIAKLPATEESFQLMISTPPSARPQQPLYSHSSSNASFTNNNGTSQDSKNTLGVNSGVYNHDRDQRQASYSSPAPARQLEDQYPAAATAAVALAQLHSQRQESDWGSEAVSDVPHASYGGRYILIQVGQCLGTRSRTTKLVLRSSTDSESSTT